MTKIMHEDMIATHAIASINKVVQGDKGQFCKFIVKSQDGHAVRVGDDSASPPSTPPDSFSVRLRSCEGDSENKLEVSEPTSLAKFLLASRQAPCGAYH